jgi:hypothetical protein
LSPPRGVGKGMAPPTSDGHTTHRLMVIMATAGAVGVGSTTPGIEQHGWAEVDRPGHEGSIKMPVGETGEGDAAEKAGPGEGSAQRGGDIHGSEEGAGCGAGVSPRGSARSCGRRSREGCCGLSQPNRRSRMLLAPTEGLTYNLRWLPAQWEARRPTPAEHLSTSGRWGALARRSQPRAGQLTQP